MSSIRANVLFSGLPDIKAALRTASRRLSKAGEAGIYAVAVDIIKEAKRRAPVDTGALQASGYVTMPSGGTLELGFGGYGRTSRSGTFPEKYAIIQHEFDYDHAVGESHYLLHAIDNALSGRGGLIRAARVAQEVFESNGSITRQLPTTPEG